MKLIAAEGGKFVFQLGAREKVMLFKLFRLYPVVEKPCQPLSKSADADSIKADQELLEQALTIQKSENKKALEALLGNPEQFQKTKHGHRLTLDGEQMEWLLQVLNDIRLGSWYSLGCPDEDTFRLVEINESNLTHAWAMDACGMYQSTLLKAFDGMPPDECFPVRLGRRHAFPNPLGAPASGLVAIGGDLTVARLLMAYRLGIFPWSVRPITWWSPDPRGIFELDGFKVSRSLARRLRRQPFQITRNRAFKQVMLACATAPGRNSTWISPQFINAYVRLHEQGHAHSVECWQDGKLVGGVYGVAVGGLFAGESMFHHVSDASKVALYHLIEHLRACKFQLLDIQTLTPIARQLGAVHIPRAEYLQRLRQAVDSPAQFI